ncbi:hypothetical protein AJ79_10249 [Helicocarpus griseus UAMH5409]|uniref:Uncharacterized protein n=1 Tax=Helicocarpus griseus UAMH5409 TaxID=1447875 RepID=A0A2B7WEM6_9EURO|nr:hypothetical protein AJ79_10249 [Helicocarpus griseus UAMH5409]
MDPSQLQCLIDLAQSSPDVQTPQACKMSFGADLEEHMKMICWQVLSQTSQKLTISSESFSALNFEVVITSCHSNCLQVSHKILSLSSFSHFLLLLIDELSSRISDLSSQATPVEDNIREEFKCANDNDECSIFEFSQVCEFSAEVKNLMSSFPELSPEVQEVDSHK